MQLAEEDKQRVMAAGLKVRYFAPVKATTTVFPYRTKLSILVAVMKVYPAMKKQGVTKFAARFSHRSAHQTQATAQMAFSRFTTQRTPGTFQRSSLSCHKLRPPPTSHDACYSGLNPMRQCNKKESA